ncbi:hypothetical protein [Jeotgalibacillus aurantiacus]|nr:hypothetical protein [Jeotgalibacillus aurantiacus]
MGWALLLALFYAPMFYQIHKRLRYLENRVAELEGEKEGRVTK